MSRPRRPTVSESSMARRQAASVRQAASARATSCIWRRSVQVALAVSSRNAAITASGRVRHQGVCTSRVASSR